MKLTNLFSALFLTAGVCLLVGCEGNPITLAVPSPIGLPNGATLPNLVGSNIIPITVNGSNCDPSTSSNYYNKPCVSVQVCTSGTSTCQTINDVLLDTGSTGLRVFKSALTVSLTPDTINAQPVGECYQYADGTANWGPVETADVILGSEVPVTLPIQVIDSTFATVPTTCTGAATAPSDAGWTAILGVNFNSIDCGAECAQNASDSFYYSCTNASNGSTCAQVQVPVTQQIPNPVSLQPTDNNGVIVELPTVPLGGVSSVNGYLVLGIGTETNNVPSGVTSFQADPDIGYFGVGFQSAGIPGFIDSGTNLLAFPIPSSITDCVIYNGNDAGAFCPTTPQTFNASVFSIATFPAGLITITIGNYVNLLGTSNSVFSELGAAPPSTIAADMDLGLPFFMGRNVYVGMEGASSSLGTGDYWAF